MQAQDCHLDEKFVSVQELWKHAENVRRVTEVCTSRIEKKEDEIIVRIYQYESSQELQECVLLMISF